MTTHIGYIENLFKSYDILIKMEAYFTNQHIQGIKAKAWELKRVPAKVISSGNEKDFRAEDLSLPQGSYPRNHLIVLCESASDHYPLLPYPYRSEVYLEFFGGEAAKLIDYHGRNLDGKNVYLLLEGPHVVGIGLDDGALSHHHRNLDEVMEVDHEDKDTFEGSLVPGTSFIEELAPFMLKQHSDTALSPSSNSQGNFWNIFRKARKMRKEI